MASELWTTKYTPQRISDIKGNEEPLKNSLKFLLKYDNQKKKALMLYGPSGTGKTSFAYAFAHEYNYDIVEINNSQGMNKNLIEDKLKNMVNQGSLFGNKKIILIDNLDGISGQKDRGAASTIAKIIKKSTFPIIITCTNPYEKKLSPVRKISSLVEFVHVDKKNIEELLGSISKKENFEMEEEHKSMIAESAQGDMRAAINDLQMVVKNGKVDKTLIDNLDERMQDKEMKYTLKNIFKGDNPKNMLRSFDDVGEDHNKLMIWLDYNMPKEYQGKIERAKAYGCLTKADVFMSRIRRKQHWRFLVYINALLTAGVGLSKDKINPIDIHYKEGNRILKIWQANMKYSKRKSICEKLAEKQHSSIKQVTKDFSYIKNAILSSSEWIGLDEEEKKYLQKINSN
ncbi:MAG: replication factor C large subunit [Nanobdellota archaeon]